MKTVLCLICIILVVFFICLPHSSAQHEVHKLSQYEEHKLLGLPEGAKALLGEPGKGGLSWLTFSPDGAHLALAGFYRGFNR